ncbi:MAG TPA: glycosyltransferase [Candidatus Sulfotelmatobacter sp.]|nr:glycosyltransferase [Candidatus Sulfotelmatobacter sp.]
MIQLVKLTPTITLDDYAAITYLSASVNELRTLADSLLPHFKGRSVLMLNSAASGGGVAEMLPRMVLMLNELGINAQWAVMETDKPEFFQLTKRLHNLIHGEGVPDLSQQDQQLYETVSGRIAEELRTHIKPDDLLVVHDPQPLAVGARLKQQLPLRALWRCHIGVDADLPATRAAWTFLRPYAKVYDHAIFSAPEYIPDYLSSRACVIHPGIDPLSHKNRPLTPHKLAGILCNAGLAREHAPVLTPPFPEQAKRLQPDGSSGPATQPDEIGFLYRPIIAQVSRWDRLKGFQPLLEGFVRFKQKLQQRTPGLSPRDQRRQEIVRLVLAGPDPGFVKDDPEGGAVFEDLRTAYCRLKPEFQQDIAVLSLPMESRKNNELMVNAIQRCATIVVQNSLREGFGLTVTEAMWKGTPVLGTYACGLRQQIRDGIDGRLILNPQDPQEIADKLEQMLADDAARERWSRNAQKRAHTEFLVFAQMHRWLQLLAQQVGT